MGEKETWIRDGGRACLDFVNTLRDRYREPWETLHTSEDLVAWLRGADLLGAEAPCPDRQALRAAWLLREAIDGVVLAAAGGELPQGQHLSQVNAACLQAVRSAPQLMVSGGRLTCVPRAGRADDAPEALGLLAEDAIDLVVSPEIARVRVCAADQCALRFIDRSPARNRQWCSMARCGNRAKARRHYARSAG